MSSFVALPPHGTHVHLNNRWRNKSDSAYQFRLPPLAFGITGIGSYLLQVKSIITQNFVPNVQRDVSDQFAVTVNGTTTIIVLEEADYPIDDLVDALNTALAPIDPALQFTYDYLLKKLSLTIPAGLTFSFAMFNQQSQQDTYYYTNPYDRFIAMLGFSWERGKQYTGPYTLQASEPVNLIATSMLNIYVLQNLNVVNTMNTNPQTLATVPVQEPYGSVIGYEPVQPRTFVMNPQVIEYLEVAVCDEYGRSVKVPSNVGLHISFTLIPNSSTYE